MVYVKMVNYIFTLSLYMFLGFSFSFVFFSLKKVCTSLGCLNYGRV